MTVHITVVGFGALRERIGDGTGSTELDVDDGARIVDVIAALSIPPALATMVLIDGDQAQLDDVVAEGTEVTLMPPFAGGAY